VTKGALYGGILAAADDGTEPETNIVLPAGVSDVDTYSVPAGYCMAIVSENPGDWGNDLGIQIEQDTEDAEAFYLYVYEQLSDGSWELRETWSCSRVKNKKNGYGKAHYVEDVVNGVSDYIRVIDNTSVDEDLLPVEQPTTLQFDKGYDGIAPTATEYSAGWNEFKDRNLYPVRYLCAAGVTDSTVISKMDEVAGVREDCVAYIDPPRDNTASAFTNTISWRNGLSITNVDRVSISGFPWGILQDEYTDKEVLVPLSGYAAAVAMYSHNNFGIEYAPMGPRRAIIPITDLDISITDSDESDIYDDQINPIIQKSGIGILRNGQKNLKALASALDRENVRYLLDDIEWPMRDFLDGFVGENNTEFNRLQVEQGIDAFLRPYKARQALYDYRVTCDDTNNPPEIIDKNELHVDVFVKPVRTAEFIKLKVVVTRSDANLQELFG
jgi:hypothetical protein